MYVYVTMLLCILVIPIGLAVYTDDIIDVHEL